MINMEQLTWDYKGYENYPPLLQTSLEETIQTDWNITIITKINQMSAIIHQKTHRGGANKIKINSVLLPLFKDLEYFNIDDHNHMSLGGRYNISIDDSLPEDIILCYHETPDLFELRNKGFVFSFIKENEELSLVLLKIDSEEYQSALNDSKHHILNEDNCKGEIKILNYYE